MSRQYVMIKFRPNDTTAYTYHHDGDPLTFGDEVLIPDHRGGDPKRVVVVGTRTDKPKHFETKAILGLAPPKEDATA